MKYSKFFTVILISNALLLGCQSLNVGENTKNRKVAQIEISQIDGTLNRYMIDVGNYPEQGVGLEALVENTTGSSDWKGPYLKKMPVDPWGNPYIYSFPGMHGIEYDLCSNGADGIQRTDDDICNWK